MSLIIKYLETLKARQIAQLILRARFLLRIPLLYIIDTTQSMSNLAILCACGNRRRKKKKIKYSSAIPVRIHRSALFFYADISTFPIIADTVMTLIRYHVNVLPCINYPLCLRAKVGYGFFLSYLFVF